MNILTFDRHPAAIHQDRVATIHRYHPAPKRRARVWRSRRRPERDLP